jgi:hypothetical protein
MLAFDSSSIRSLLHDDNFKYYDPKYPIIYKYKIFSNTGKGSFISNALDNALRANQIRAIDLIVDYIVKHQNNFVSSFLMTKNLPLLLDKGIEVCELLKSNIFTSTIDFERWPSNH